MSHKKKAAGALTPATMHTGQSLMNRPFEHQYTINDRKGQIIALLDFALEQQRKLQRRALLANDDRQAQALRNRAQQWADGREELAALVGGGR